MTEQPIDPPTPPQPAGEPVSEPDVPADLPTTTGPAEAAEPSPGNGAEDGKPEDATPDPPDAEPAPVTAAPQPAPGVVKVKLEDVIAATANFFARHPGIDQALHTDLASALTALERYV